MTEQLENFLKKKVSEENGYQKVDYINQYSLTTEWSDTHRDWQVSLRKCGSWSVQLEIEFSDLSDEHIEFDYVIILNHKNSSAKNALVFRGKGMIDEESNPIFISNHKLSTFHRLQGVSFENMYMKFAVVVNVFYDEDGIRNFMFSERNDRLLSPRIIVNGRKLNLWMMAIERRLPHFAMALGGNRIDEKMNNYLGIFIQVIHGVHIQLKKKEIKPILKMATKYKVVVVKKYCENQLIWRDDFKFSKKQKFKMACKFNLNILMRMESVVVSNSGIQVELADETIWRKFYPHTEMITKRGGGRMLFPRLEYKIKGLQPDCSYKMYLFVERADGEKYKYEHGMWRSIGKGVKPLRHQFKEHPFGARLGSDWMSQKVSFSHLKLTNHPPDNTDSRMIVVQSMHKYLPVVMIKKVGDNNVCPEEFRLKLTEFYAVTDYQSERMTSLKVAHNKFAKKILKEKITDVSGPAVPVEPSPSRQSMYSASNSSTPASVTPPTGEHNLEAPSPVLFDQTTPVPNLYTPMANQPHNYPVMMHPYYWNYYPQNYGTMPMNGNAAPNNNQFNYPNYF